MSDEALLRLHEEAVRPEWIDFNGHMNLAFYVLAFDHATDRFLHHVALGEAYMRRSGCSVFILETHVVYKREMRLGDRMRFTTQLLGHDAKRLHFIHHMYHAGEGFLAAANEIMGLHVDMRTRRSASIPTEAADALARLRADQARLPIPPEAGRSIALTHRDSGAPPRQSEKLGSAR
jgi:acyl-CoA thioester hydrolase